MNIRDLKYLLAIADHNHFGLAAEACYVSQPALSMQIKKLENDLGVQLIERNNRSLMFTTVGKLIVQEAREVLNRVESLRTIAQYHQDPFCGELQLGIIPTLAPYLLPYIIPKLSKLLPKLSIYLIEDITQNLMTKLSEGKLDTVILALPIETNFVSKPLFDEEFLLGSSLKHPLAKKKHIHLNDLENKTLLLLEDGHCLRDQALSFCHQANANESKNFRATSLETLRHMVATGIGITLMPKLACKTNDGVHYTPFKSPKPKRKIGMLWRKASMKEKLFEFIANWIKNQNILKSN